MVPVNSDQIDTLRVVAHQSFSFRTHSKAVFASLCASFHPCRPFQLEILALRHQIGVLQRSVKRAKLTATDRLLGGWLGSIWNGWEARLALVKAAPVIGCASPRLQLVLALEGDTASPAARQCRKTCAN